MAKTGKLEGLRAAVIQMSSGADVETNLEMASRLIAQAAEQSVHLVVLPENFACLQGDLKDLGQQEASEKHIQTFLADQANQHSFYLVGGTTPCGQSPDGSINFERNWASCYVYGADGQPLARYDKIHLFDVCVADGYGAYRESHDYHHGEQTVTCDVGGVTLGLSVCYDLRFPELYRALSADGAQIMSVPAAFTKVTGAAHWEILIRSRAIENQAFVLAANQCGSHLKGRESWGHSMIVSPNGDILAEAGTEPGVIVAELDLTQQEQIRLNMPCLQHRRLV